MPGGDGDLLFVRGRRRLVSASDAEVLPTNRPLLARFVLQGGPGLL
jgi:hypothetical protein